MRPHLHGPALLLTLLLAPACSTTSTRAWNTGPPAPDSAVPARVQEPPEPERAEDDELERRNTVSLLLGGTHRDDETSFSFGLAYERRLTKLIGLGAIFEETPSAREPILLIPAVYLHPVGGLYFELAPGFEFAETETLPLFRMGVGWEFEVGRGFFLAPEVNYDMVSSTDDALVVGLVLGYKF